MGSLGEVVADSVMIFAKVKNLQSELWYQNEPLWIANDKSEKPGIIREIQVACFANHGLDQLYFIPCVYDFTEDMVLATPEEITGRMCLACPKSTLRLFDDAIQRQIILDFLANTWKLTLLLKQERLVEVG